LRRAPPRTQTVTAHRSSNRDGTSFTPYVGADRVWDSPSSVNAGSSAVAQADNGCGRSLARTSRYSRWQPVVASPERHSVAAPCSDSSLGGRTQLPRCPNSDRTLRLISVPCRPISTGAFVIRLRVDLRPQRHCGSLTVLCFAMNENVHKLSDSDLKGLILQATGLDHDSRVASAILSSFKQLKPP
jgi:hypothetical protein